MNANQHLIQAVRSTCAVVALLTLSVSPFAAAQGGNGKGGGRGGGGGGGGEPPAEPEIAYIEDGAVWGMGVDGSNKASIFDGGWVHWVSWSSAGSRLAVTAEVGGVLGLWTIDADGSNLQLVKELHWTSYLWDIQWSPVSTADGQEKILFIELTTEAADGTFDVFAVNPDGTGLVHLVQTPTPTDEQSCTWSPDATRIAVIEGDTGGAPGRTMLYDIGLVDGVLGVTGTEEVLNMPPEANDVDWARTQNKLAVVSFVQGSANNNELWIIDLDDPQSRQQITFFDEQDRHPTWSRDDSFLAFDRSPRPRKQTGIRKVSVDGTNDASLGAKQGSRPDWKRTAPVATSTVQAQPRGALAGLLGISAAPVPGTSWTVGVRSPRNMSSANKEIYLSVSSAAHRLGTLVGPVIGDGAPALFRVPIPDQPALVGGSLYVQAWVRDPESGITAVTGAYRVEIRSK